MANRPARPCLSPGCPAVTRTGSRCPAHQINRHQRGYGNDWYRLSKAAIAAQPWCSRCYATTDLTADHIIPLHRGGQGVPENVRVLCRSCNSSKGAR